MGASSEKKSPGGYVPSRHPSRELFRVEFPFDRRPTARWRNAEYDVLDFSERGLRLVTEGRMPMALGATVVLSVRFEDSAETVEGIVYKSNLREAVVRLSTGFPLERVRREERRLIRALRPSPPSAG